MPLAPIPTKNKVGGIPLLPRTPVYQPVPLVYSQPKSTLGPIQQKPVIKPGGASLSNTLKALPSTANDTLKKVASGNLFGIFNKTPAPATYGSAIAQNIEKSVPQSSKLVTVDPVTRKIAINPEEAEKATNFAGMLDLGSGGKGKKIIEKGKKIFSKLNEVTPLDTFRDEVASNLPKLKSNDYVTSNGKINLEKLSESDEILSKIEKGVDTHDDLIRGKELIKLSEAKNKPAPIVEPLDRVLSTRKLPVRSEGRVPLRSDQGRFNGSEPKPYAGETDLSTKILEKLKGRSLVNKQFIADLTRSPDLKQAEKDLIQKALADEGSSINVPNFAKKVKGELLPLNTKLYDNQATGAGTPQYEYVNLPAKLRGEVQNYGERVYESPVPYKNPDHFTDETDNYFGHTRFDDLPDGQTRRISEVQADLYQKGRLEKEKRNIWADMKSPNDSIQKITEREGRAAVDKMYSDRAKKFEKLTQYNDPTAHFRMIREEVKKAATDGKTKLQFPTGETAMKIEGLGDNTNWYNNASEAVNGVYPKLNKEELSIGMEVRQDFTPWIITDVLGDGKFKAVSKERFNRGSYNSTTHEATKWQSTIDVPDTSKESFDISGKVDTNNPIYKFYDKEVGKYLKNKYGAQLVTDSKGVSWWEVPVNKGHGQAPVEAFGAFGGFEVEKDENGKITGIHFDPTKAALGVAGMAGFTQGKKYFTRSEANSLKIQLDNVREMLNNHPAKGLAKYANKNGELPEVLGGVSGKFAKGGDDIVTQLGFGDSETARIAYQDYLKGKKRVAEMEAQYKIARESSDPAKDHLEKLKGIYDRKIANKYVDQRIGERSALKTDLQTTTKALPSAKQGITPKFQERQSPSFGASGNKIQLVSEQNILQQSQNNWKGSGINRIGGDSLNDIVEKAPISVKDKVGLLDFFRTPNRILEKIGLKKESDLIRKQYDKYITDLPKEIDKVTQWSKRVSKESNEKIFKWLDGQPSQLNEGELRVATEIKDDLKNWARKLGLPEDKQITNYITHLFDADLIQKEFPDEMAKIIQNNVPGSVFDPFLQHRTGALGYKQDTWQALDAYLKRATRKFHMDPALERLKAASKDLEISQFNYVKKYADRINLRPTDMDTSIDNTFKQLFGYKVGQRPVANLSQKARRVLYRGTLGLNIGSAFRNLTQGANTYARLGEKHTIIGYIKALTGGSEELERVGVLRNDLIQDRVLNSTKKFWEKTDKGLFFMFELAERINRGAAYFGAKSKAISKGMSESEAVEFAKKIVRDTQFTFGSVDTPVALQSDLVKLFAQFQSYNFKQAEFLTEMAKNKDIMGLVRWSGASLAMVFTVGKLFGMKPTDLIPFTNTIFGNDSNILIPPSIKPLYNSGKEALSTEDDFGNARTASERATRSAKALIPYAPGGVQMKKTIEGINDVNQGASFTKSGKERYSIEQTPTNYVRAGLFGKSNLPEAREYYNREDALPTPYEKELKTISDNKAVEKKRVKPIYDQAQKLKDEGKVEEAKALVNSLTEEDYEIYKSIKTSEKTKATQQGKAKMYPMVKKIQELKEGGDIQAAQMLVDRMSDEEYRLYKLAKESLGIK